MPVALNIDYCAALPIHPPYCVCCATADLWGSQFLQHLWFFSVSHIDLQDMYQFCSVYQCADDSNLNIRGVVGTV